jgi:hypothetical protein
MLDTSYKKGSPKVSRLNRSFAFAMVLLGLTATHAQASLVISMSNVNVAPGNIGSMEIDVSSTSSDTLSAFGLELQISGVNMPTSVLQFTTSQPDPYSNPNYVFAGQSFNADNGPIPFWTVSTPPNPFVTIFGGDLNDSLQGYVTIPATVGGPYSYLANIQFQAPVGATLGDQFQVSLVSNPSFTYFDDQNSNPLTIKSVSGGLVTIAASVPEPASLTMMAFAGLSGLLCFGRARR